MKTKINPTKVRRSKNFKYPLDLMELNKIKGGDDHPNYPDPPPTPDTLR